MLSKFISVSETRSLPSNTEPNPRELFNATNIQNDEGVVEPEPEPRQEIVLSKGRDEVDQNTNKPVTIEYKPRVPYPNATRKDRSDEQFGELTLRVEDETITLQARNSGITSNIEEELDKWLAHKPRTHDKPKLRQNKPDTFPNQLKVDNKVLLDAADPHIVTTTPNEEIPLMVLSIFPFSMVEESHPKFDTFKHTRPSTRACLKPWPSRGRDMTMRYGRVEVGHDFPKIQDAINPHGPTTWLWVNLAVDNNTRAWYPNTRAWEKHDRTTWPCTTNAPDTRVRDSSRVRPKLQNSKNTSSPSEYTGVALGRVHLPYISKSLFIFFFLSKP
ncbi:hypothetical protein GOBAR_AA25301 [Gossypium barbadense]|uniref:Uncharacterized protein n=1 Tax=Gossypium barbadense TaxID=3634 RepID=A0A2P5WWA3_GOSBA|nr:hypothetical protein GOBAR_AA25301 [Gossypium barbadense]